MKRYNKALSIDPKYVNALNNKKSVSDKLEKKNILS